MLKKFINRPVLATVISLLFVLLGLIGILKLPITRFPEIAPPSVSVSASYAGANAETIATGVLMPLEERINGVQDMTYIKSSASTGSGTVNVYFKQGTDPNQAAVNVQTRVSSASTDLPAEVVNDGVTVTPRQTGTIMTLRLYSDDPAFDETFLQFFVKQQIDRELLRIDGVAGVSRIGGRNYAMKIWLNPNKMKAYGLVPSDVNKALDNQNFAIAPGQFGQYSDQAFQTVITYAGRYNSPEEFGNVVVKTNPDGSILRLKDVAKIELSASNDNSENRVDGVPGVVMNITQNSGSNAREIDIAIRQKMEELSKSFPSGIKYDVSYSIREQIDGSISQVVHTLIEAFILVFIIVFIFLQNLRATLIPAIAIPVSLVSTFFFIYLLGFSINVLTLFALVLAIGIVVDDAIVVVEAVFHKMDTTDLSPREATVETMEEITPAILSITMVMAAVFLPIGFMEGPSGVFYRQFAYTLATAIGISALNALTLSPALCALFLRRHDSVEDNKEGMAETPPKLSTKAKAKSVLDLCFVAFNTFFDKMTDRYIKVVVKLCKKRKLALLGLIVISGIGFLAMKFTPTAFIPNEDDGFIMYTLKLPPGSSLMRTKEVLHEALGILQEHDEIMSMSSSAGYNGIDGTTSSSYALGYINMYPQAQRKGIKDIHAFMDTIRADLSQITGASITVFTRPTVQGFGEQSGLQFVIEDKLAGDIQTLGAVANDFIAELNKTPEIQQASTTFQANFPQYELIVDRDKAKVMGVNVKDMMNAIRAYYSRLRVSEFNLLNRLNRVYLQGDPKYTEAPESMSNIFVRNATGDMVPVNTLVKLVKTFGPEIVTRYNLFNSVEVNAQPGEDFSSGDAMEKVNALALEKLPGNYQIEWTGMSLEEQKSSGQTAFILLMSIVFVYILLSAQYESYILPMSILLSIPVGLIGVFAVINLVGLQNNIYAQVGLIMLIGLLAKNAILVVEFSVQHRQAGHSIFESAIEGARLRLRPILMTSLAFVAGLVPLMWTVGPSAQGNHSISFSAAGGMISGVIFGIFIVPVLFIIFKTLDEKVKAKFNNEKH